MSESAGEEGTLPAGWAKAFSRSQQKVYFYHEGDKASLWSLAEVQAHEEAKRTGREKQNTENALATQRNAEEGSKSADPGEILNQPLDVFETCLRKQVEEMLADTSRHSLRIGPTTKPQRLIITEVADDENLSTRSEFQEITRYTFVTLYKEGFHPDDLLRAKLDNPAVPAQAPVKAAPKPTKRARDHDPVVPLDDSIALQPVGHQNKRDRRSIEEIRRDMEAKAKAKK